MFEWKDEYSVNIVSIDAQHRVLFQIAGELHAAMAAGQGKAACAKVLNRLVQYTASHFSHEERLMRERHYSDFDAHKAQHDALTKQVLQFEADYNNGQVMLTVQLMQFLQGWLTNHIRNTDTKYVPYLAGKITAPAEPLKLEPTMR
ncbi:MAG TPA: bacteriohemerythrin [Bryobacteraceae bacterium]|nr:bacteriohemerythrin [Bryobacteraceae bacterium]